MLAVFHQTTGINAVTFFSNEIFKDGDDGNAAEKRARLGTFLYGVVACIGTGSSIWLNKYFPRKFFLLYSLIIVAFCLFLAGVSASFNSNLGIILSTLVYACIFDGGIGPTFWVYASDILDGPGMSVVALINMTFVCIFATFANLMFETFSAEGMYFGLTVINSLAALFVWKFIKETKGLTKEECEKLYKEE